MSTMSAPNDSPSSNIQPLHNPSQAAHVVVPQAPVGSIANQAPGQGAKALLAKKMAKNQSSNPAFVSPTDNLMTPVTQKLNAARKKNFDKGAKPIQLFSKSEGAESDDETPQDSQPADRKDIPQDDDENPF